MVKVVQTRAEVLEIIASHRQDLAALGVSEVWLFGSAARDELCPHSDNDVLVRLSRSLGLAFFDIAPALEGWLGRRVDVGTFDGLHERALAQAQREAVRVA